LKRLLLKENESNTVRNVVVRSFASIREVILPTVVFVLMIFIGFFAQQTIDPAKTAKMAPGYAPTRRIFATAKGAAEQLHLMSCCAFLMV